MRFKSHVLVAAGCVSLMAMNAPAFSQPVSRGAEQRPAPRSYAERVAAASRPVFGWPDLVKEARKYIGTNPTDRKRLWCATFMNLVLTNLGYPGTNSDAAKSFAYYGRRISKPEVGAIAVLTRGKRGGHVGVVSGVDANGNPVIISGNHNKRVGVAVYPRSRVIAYVLPTGRNATGAVAGRTAARRGIPERGAPAENGFDSPIAELIAAINAEGDRAEAPRAQPVKRRRPVRRTTQPRRVVQQLPEQRTDAGDQGLAPALAELFGVRDQAQAAQQGTSERRARVRQRSVRQSRASRVAAEPGLAGFLGLPNPQ